jgi:hypothetical protein
MKTLGDKKDEPTLGGLLVDADDHVDNQRGHDSPAGPAR